MNWRIQIAAYTIQCTEDYHDKGLGNMSNLRAQGVCTCASKFAVCSSEDCFPDLVSRCILDTSCSS